MRAVPVALLLLILLPETATGQEVQAVAGYEDAVPANPTPQWPIGCAVSAGGVPQDVFAMGYVEWAVDGQVIGQDWFTMEGWGYISDRFVRYVDATIPDMNIHCYVEVSFSGFNQIIRKDAYGTVTGLRPIVEVLSDTENYVWNDRIRRDIWYYIRNNSNLQGWTLGGTVTETFEVMTNPCNLDISTGLGNVDAAGRFLDTLYTRLHNPPRPECATRAIQSIRLSTALNQEILRQGWWWDTSGVWRW